MKVLNISFSEITRYLHFELKTWVKQNVMMRIQISVIWFQNSTFISFAGIQKREHCSQLWSDVLKFVLTGEIYCVMILMCVTDTYNTMCPDVVEKEKETNKKKKDSMAKMRTYMQEKKYSSQLWGVLVWTFWHQWDKETPTVQ